VGARAHGELEALGEGVAHVRESHA
jgi:hypothetical protein